ncbi:hypothetical protein QQF64_028607 [Cirrhinus molitorella]|uniref:Uncharacterized protein n=1 Tax=Cirrhinus molitorella TaxID=172907 RepID=A0ABR3N742_9TELE
MHMYRRVLPSYSTAGTRHAAPSPHSTVTNIRNVRNSSSSLSTCHPPSAQQVGHCFRKGYHSFKMDDTLDNMLEPLLEQCSLVWTCRAEPPTLNG